MELPSEFPQIPEAEAKDAKDFLELSKEGFTPFSIGTLYVYAGVKEDLVRRFAAEEGGKQVEDLRLRGPGDLIRNKYKLEPRGCHLRFEKPVVTQCGADWGYLLNIIDTQSFPHFKKWLLSQQFVNRAEKKFYIVRHYNVPVVDPLALSLKGLAIPSTLDVFSLSGMKGVLQPRTHLATPDAPTLQKQAYPYVIFDHLPPEEDTIKLGAAAFQIVREG